MSKRRTGAKRAGKPGKSRKPARSKSNKSVAGTVKGSSLRSLKKELAELQRRTRAINEKLRRNVRKQTLSKKQITTILRQQKKERLQAREHKAAIAAMRAFKAKTGDRGKLRFVGTKGQRDSAERGRKGYLVRVDKTGKKTLVKQHKHGFKATKFKDIQTPFQKKTWRQAQEFEAKKSTGKLRGQGKLATTGANSFSDRTVSTLAKSIKKAIESQASHRQFIIRVSVYVELPTGSTKTYEFSVPIDKADHIAIELAGIENFVRQKFYAYMARELSFDGLVSSGSANHIRRLKANKGKARKDWTDKSGQKWRGNEDDIVKILAIEWRIEQAK